MSEGLPWWRGGSHRHPAPQNSRLLRVGPRRKTYVVLMMLQPDMPPLTINIRFRSRYYRMQIITPQAESPEPAHEILLKMYCGLDWWYFTCACMHAPARDGRLSCLKFSGQLTWAALILSA